MMSLGRILHKSVAQVIALILLVAVALPFLPANVRAATLDVTFDVRTRAVADGAMQLRKNVAIFVLDRSGSMRWPPEKDEKLANGELATNRNQLLVESFKERVRSISATDPNTCVYLIPFSGACGTNSSAYSLKTKSDVDKLLRWDGLSETNCSGCTYLYDTLAYAISFAERLCEQDSSVRISLYVYTDGENETTSKIAATYRSEKRTDILGRIDYVAYKRQLEEAKAFFEKDHGWKLASYANNGKMETYWRWLGSGKPPDDSLMKIKDEYKVELVADAALLKNPMAAPNQKLSVSLVVPLPEQYLVDGVSVPVTLQLSGKDVGRKMIALKPGHKTMSFQFDDNISTDNFTGRLMLSDLPEWDRVILRSPAPLELTFAAPGKLSFMDINPKGEFFAKKGAVRNFEAKATEDAEIHWSWPGGTKSGNICPMAFSTAGTFDVVVKAHKEGSLDVEEKVAVHIIDADVGVRVITQQPTVGKAVEFEAKFAERPESFSWKVDGQTMSGAEPVLKVPAFSVGGRHIVNVRAYYGHGIVSDSGDVPVMVASKPYVEVLEPSGGSEYAFGEKIDCRASVEGDFDKVVWKLDGPVMDRQEAVVDKTAKVSKQVSFKPIKGGRYTLTATAEGAAGQLPANNSVLLIVAHENLGIDIFSHASGASVPVGRNEKAVVLMANVRGTKITKVKWFERKESGEEREIRVTPVQNGIASCSYLPDASTKDGTSLFVRAEAVIDDDTSLDAVVSPSIELVARRYAEIEVEATVNGGEANGREVRFGDQVDLRAKCGGDIDSGRVQWFKSVDNVAVKMEEVRGLTGSTPKEVPNGENLRTVRYFAVADLSDGSAVTSRFVVVHHYCPDVELEIDLEKRTFGLREAIDIGLKNADKLVDVKWDFGEGPVPDGPDARHRKFGGYGEFTINVSGICPHCKKEYTAKPVEIKIEKQPVMACFEIEPSKSSYGVNGVVHLIDKSSGDVGQRIWFVNGKEIPDSKDVTKVDYRLPKIPEDLSFSLEVKDVEGKSARIYENTIRVRFGWWLIIILFILAMFIVAIAKRILLGNELLDLSIKAHIGHAPVGNLGDLLDETDNANVSDYYLKQVRMVDKIRFILSSKINKKLIVSVSDVVGTEDADGNRFGGCGFTFSMTDGVPKVEYDERQFEYVTPRAWKSKSPMDQSDNEPNTRIVVLRDKKCKDTGVSCLYVLMRPGTPRVKSLLSFWIVAGMVLYLVFKCSVTYAI